MPRKPRIEYPGAIYHVMSRARPPLRPGWPATESYEAHRFAGTLKGKVQDFSLNLENGFNIIDGNKYGASFPGALTSAFGTGALRERRDQLQDRSLINVQYDQEKFFIRPTASFSYYDLRTVQLTSAEIGASGYQNYADRYDVNGGLDLGCKIMPEFAATLGYRYGAQYQEAFALPIDPKQWSSSSDYQRVLFGFEGKPVKWLNAMAQIGPDFRNYGPHAPVADPDLVTYYGEASLTAAITPKDSLSFKYKQYQWVSSTGKSPYFDSAFDLSYKRKLTGQLSVDLGARFLETDYTSGLNLSKLTQANPRDDSETTLSTGLTYAFNPHASVSLSYSFDLGRNLEDDVVNPESREFDRQIVSVGAMFKF